MTRRVASAEVSSDNRIVVGYVLDNECQRWLSGRTQKTIAALLEALLHSSGTLFHATMDDSPY